MKSKKSTQQPVDSDDYLADYIHLGECIRGDAKFENLIDCSKHFLMKGYTVIVPGQQATRNVELYVKFLAEKFLKIDKGDIEDEYSVYLLDRDSKIKFGASFAVFCIGKTIYAFISLLRTHHRFAKQGLATVFINSLKEYVFNQIQGKDYDGYIVANASTLHQSLPFFQHIGFMSDEVAAYFKLWKQNKCTTCVLPVHKTTFEEQKYLAANEQSKSATMESANKESARTTTDHNTSDKKSVVAPSSVSNITSKNKSGALAKHCMMENCAGIRYTGGSWNKHYTKIHKTPNPVAGKDYIKCVGDGCELCATVVQGYQGQRPSHICTTCGVNKRFDHFEGKSVICKVCVKNTTTGTSKLTASVLNAMQFNSSKSEVKPSDSISQVIGKRPRNSTIVHEFNIENTVEDIPSQQMNDINEDEGIQDYIQGQHSYKRQLLDNAITNTVLPPPSIVTAQSTPSVVFVTYSEQEVVDLLIQLETSNDSQLLNAQYLQKVCKQLSQDLVLKFLGNGEHPLICQLIIMIQQRVHQLDRQQLIGLTVASFVIGNACLSGVVKMLTLMDTEVRESILEQVGLHLSKMFRQELTGWICKQNSGA